jgi:hypothetical protein
MQSLSGVEMESNQTEFDRFMDKLAKTVFAGIVETSLENKKLFKLNLVVKLGQPQSIVSQVELVLKAAVFPPSLPLQIF